MRFYEDDDLIIDNCDDFVREDTPPTDVINYNTESEVKSNNLRDWLILFIVHLKAVYHLTETVVESIVKFLYAFLWFWASLILILYVLVLLRDFHHLCINCTSTIISKSLFKSL